MAEFGGGIEAVSFFINMEHFIRAFGQANTSQPKGSDMAYQEDWQRQKQGYAIPSPHELKAQVDYAHAMAQMQAQTQEAKPEMRAIHQATHELDHALQALARAVEAINLRTEDVQSAATPIADVSCATQRPIPSSTIAQIITAAAIRILDEVEKLENMDSRIQL